MVPLDSVTAWIEQLKAKTGDPDPVEKLWARYFPRLAGLARRHLAGMRSRMADGEDVALVALEEFFRDAETGRFAALHDRDDLRRLLFAITIHKAQNLRRAEERAKRGGPLTGHALPADGDGAGGFEDVIAEQPSPDEAAVMAELWQLLLSRLQPADLQIVRMKLREELTAEQIAARLDLSPRTIRRKLEKIQALWKEQCDVRPDPAPPRQHP